MNFSIDPAILNMNAARCVWFWFWTSMFSVLFAWFRQAVVFGELMLDVIDCSSNMGKFLVFVFGGVNGFSRFGLPANFMWSRLGVIAVDLL